MWLAASSVPSGSDRHRMCHGRAGLLERDRRHDRGVVRALQQADEVVAAGDGEQVRRLDAGHGLTIRQLLEHLAEATGRLRDVLDRVCEIDEYHVKSTK